VWGGVNSGRRDMASPQWADLLQSPRGAAKA